MVHVPSGGATVPVSSALDRVLTTDKIPQRPQCRAGRAAPTEALSTEAWKLSLIAIKVHFSFVFLSTGVPSPTFLTRALGRPGAVAFKDKTRVECIRFEMGTRQGYVDVT